jgi:AraC-like DNA-binding protein
MLAFVGEFPRGYVVEHVNGDNSDNRLENLRYVPWGDVCTYGEDSPHAKFSSNHIARLRRLHANGQTNISALAREFDMSRRHVRRVVAEETRKRG